MLVIGDEKKVDVTCLSTSRTACLRIGGEKGIGERRKTGAELSDRILLREENHSIGLTQKKVISCRL